MGWGVPHYLGVSEVFLVRDSQNRVVFIFGPCLALVKGVGEVLVLLYIVVVGEYSDIGEVDCAIGLET